MAPTRALARALQGLLRSSAASGPSTSFAAAAPSHNSGLLTWAAGCSTSPTCSSSTLARPSGAYQVEIDVKAFELRYLQQAANTVRDILMLTFAPKSCSALPVKEEAPRPVNLFLPTDKKDVKLDWKKSRVTLIKGPHIDKRGMEQFEQRKYKTVITASTNSAEEVQWLLEHLKLYEFTGVQLKVLLTSSTYLTPTPLPGPSTSTSGASSSSSPSASLSQQRTSVLSQHKQHIARYLQPQGPSSQDAYADELQAGLKALQDVVRTGLEHRRKDYRGQNWYATWHQRNKGKGTAQVFRDPSADPSTSTPASYERFIGERLQSLQRDLAAKGDDAMTQAQRTSAFLAAVDAVLLDLKFDVLESYRNFPLHFCTFVPPPPPAPGPTSEADAKAQNVRTAQWMQAVLKYGQYMERVGKASQEKQLLDAYTQYNVFAHTLLYSLLKTWVQSASAEAKPYLALPTQAQEEKLKEELRPGKRQ